MSYDYHVKHAARAACARFPGSVPRSQASFGGSRTHSTKSVEKALTSCTNGLYEENKSRSASLLRSSSRAVTDAMSDSEEDSAPSEVKILNTRNRSYSI